LFPKYSHAFLLQERRELTVSSCASTFANTRLTHVPLANFQTPYFPPPYNTPTDFSASVAPADPYAHLNPLQTQQYASSFQRNEDLHNRLPDMATYSSRATDYRSIIHPATHPTVSAQDALLQLTHNAESIHNMEYCSQSVLSEQTGVIRKVFDRGKHLVPIELKNFLPVGNDLN
ncbi:hypothetical protein D918_05201, partial [Trichuris suis]